MYAKWKQIDIHRITCPQQITKCGKLEYIRMPRIITGKPYIKKKKNVTMIYCTNTYRKCFRVKPKLRLLTI